MREPNILSNERESWLNSCLRLRFGDSYSSSKPVREPDWSPPPLSLSRKEDAVEDMLAEDASDSLRGES